MQLFAHTIRFIVAAAFAACTAVAQGQSWVDQRPEELEGVDIVEHLGDTLPLDLRFIDQDGNEVTLRDYFDGSVPVIVTLNYYRCPMLCTLQLNGLVDALKEIDLEPGEEYRIVTVSVDPEETHDLGALKKKGYVQALKREHGAAGWSFLVSPDNSVAKLAEAIGYGYRWDDERGEWAHSSAIFIASPDGTLTRYIYGIGFEPETVRMALIEGSQGTIGSTLDRFILWCFHYDDSTGRYTPAVMRITRLFGGLTVIVLGSGIFILWQRDRMRRREQALESALAGAAH